MRFVLAARAGAPALPGACPISVATPGDDVIGAYLRRRGIRDEHIPLLVNKAAFDARVIPSLAYTDPEVAWVGVTEE